MTPGIVKLTVAQAISRLPDGDQIQTMRSVGEILMGSEWTRRRVETAIRKSPFIEQSGPTATEAGFGIAIEDRGDPVFIETKVL